jgi:hypothetical protein
MIRISIIKKGVDESSYIFDSNSPQHGDLGIGFIALDQ